MNNTYKTYLAAVTGLFTIMGTASAQETSIKSDSLPNETVVIVRPFEPVIKDAKKINHQPVINNVDKKTPHFKYNILPQNLVYKFNPDTINAVKIKGEPLTKLYRAYLKAGIGSFVNNYGELHINSLRSRDFQWGLDVQHFASNGGISDYPDSFFSNQDVSLYGKKLLKHHAITAGFNFNRAQVNKYGLNRVVDWECANCDPYPLGDIKQTYMYYGGNAGIQSFLNDSNDLNYKINFKYYNLGVDPSATIENNFLMTSEFSKFYGTEKAYLFLDVDYNQAQMDSSITKQEKQSNLLIKPSVNIEFNGSKWHLIAGFKMALENGESTRFYFFPNAEFKYNVVRNLIVPYAGITGNAKRNSMNSLRLENPYLSATPELKTSRTTYDAYFGVRGLISSNLSYNISAGYKEVKDMVLYSSAIPLGNGFNTNAYENTYLPIYDTVTVAHISTQIAYQKEEKWNVIWRLNYNYYEPQTEAVAWNLPDLTSDITLRYNLQDKIMLKSSFTFMNSKYVKTDIQEGNEELAFGVYGRKIDPVLDFNIGLEYRFTKKISAFVDANNILGQNYEIWGNYQVQGFNVMGGVTIAFWAK